MDFMDILETVFGIYRNHFRLIFGICTVYFILTLGVTLAADISTFFFESSGLQGMAIAINPIATWIITLISLFSLGALLFTGAQIYLGNPITAGAAFSQVTRRFWSYLGSSVLFNDSCCAVGANYHRYPIRYLFWHTMGILRTSGFD